MKRKAIVLFVVVSFLLSMFFMGCDNGTTSGNGDFVLIPVDPIDPPYVNIPTLDNYDAIFAGENHTNRENYEVYPKLMEYYYSLGIRDFAFEEGGHGSALLIQYYIDTGDGECLEFIIKDNEGSPAYNQERYNFYKWMYNWNATLKQKIKVYNFDVSHSYNASRAAIFLLILRKYPRIEGIPNITTPGTPQEFVNDFKNNKARYSRISSEDMKLFEKIIANIEQGFDFYATQNDSTREQNMIKNFQQIIKDTGGRKIFAIMGANHASLNGIKDGTFDYDFTMASRLKNEIRIASVVLRQQPDPDRWQYIIRIDETKKTTPFNSTYNGNWPWNLAW